jgi:hypothetical protein
MHAIVILKQADALNGADGNLDGHACKPSKNVCVLCMQKFTMRIYIIVPSPFI